MKRPDVVGVTLPEVVDLRLALHAAGPGFLPLHSLSGVRPSAVGSPPRFTHSHPVSDRRPIAKRLSTHGRLSGDTHTAILLWSRQGAGRMGFSRRREA